MDFRLFGGGIESPEKVPGIHPFGAPVIEYVIDAGSPAFRPFFQDPQSVFIQRQGVLRLVLLLENGKRLPGKINLRPLQIQDFALSETGAYCIG